jgi:galactose mutarotase-like enzyme
MKIKVDENNFVVINLERGGRIVELVLGGRLIIQGNTSDTGSGNYLLYPWVNRI